MSETIHIILPVHNRRDTTAKFVDALERQTHRDYHLILVDDGCTDGTAEMVRGRVAPLTLIRGDGKLWWGGGLQKGYEWLQQRPETHADLALIINDDTVFEPDFLAKGARSLRQHEGALVLAHCHSQQTGELLDHGIHIDWMRLTFDQASTDKPVNCLPTRGLFLRVADFLRTGGFYPRLLPHYASDYEFTIRARRRGLQLVADPDLKLWFDEKTTGESEIPPGSFWSVAVGLFSHRSLANPAKWLIFVILACPWRWLPLNLLRVCWGTCLNLARYRQSNRSAAASMPGPCSGSGGAPESIKKGE